MLILPLGFQKGEQEKKGDIFNTFILISADGYKYEDNNLIIELWQITKSWNQRNWRLVYLITKL